MSGAFGSYIRDVKEGDFRQMVRETILQKPAQLAGLFRAVLCRMRHFPISSTPDKAGELLTFSIPLVLRCV